MECNMYPTHRLLDGRRNASVCLFEIKHNKCSLTGIRVPNIRRITDITASGVSGRETSRAPAFTAGVSTMPHSKNQILSLLAPQELALFANRLQVVELTHGQV